jgi:repressor LexA
MSQDGLNDMQRRIYQIIRATFLRKSRTPSRTEIKSQIYRSGTSSLEYDLGVLEKAGYIEIIKGGDGKKREHHNIRLLGMGLPLEGYIAAGEPIEKGDTSGQRIKLGLEFEDELNYVLIVRGTSMIEDGINDGDLIVVRKQATCENGQIVVASHNIEPFEATLKRFRPSGNSVYLHPANSDMEPIRISKQQWDREWQIQGVVIISFHLFDTRLLQLLGWNK